jgi:hypothetical protein
MLTSLATDKKKVKEHFYLNPNIADDARLDVLKKYLTALPVGISADFLDVRV